ncbi:MAG: TraR/DksA C4-type zinc finger protein [Deltaproteobacteria bacterium]|nr:TraR/DksA C4-type zinc finger protein [Deltaproteobacteria bacterium]
MVDNDLRHKRLKKALLDRKRKMWSDLRDEFFRKLGKEYNTQFDNPHDVEELALIDIIEDTGIAIADIRREELEKMDAALRQLEDGTYGVCEVCGEEIDEERLKVISFATTCVKCQKSGESKKPTL